LFLVVHAVISFLVSVVIFYLKFLLPEILGRALLGAPRLFFPALRMKARKTTSAGNRPTSFPMCRPRVHNPELKVSPVVAAMDGRSVQLEISFGEGFYRYRTALAWVEKPRAGKPLPTVTFDLSAPDDDWGTKTYLVQVPDEQLGDFEEVEDRNRVYRLTSVLYVEDGVREETLWE
jgi:hypothetical protein